jgi:hypothetical protein
VNILVPIVMLLAVLVIPKFSPKIVTFTSPKVGIPVAGHPTIFVMTGLLKDIRALVGAFSTVPEDISPFTTTRIPWSLPPSFSGTRHSIALCVNKTIGEHNRKPMDTFTP